MAIGQDVFLLGCVAGVKCLGTKLQELGRERERCYDWRIVLLGILLSPFYFYKGASICFLDLSRSIWIVSHFLLIDRFNSRKERKV